MSAWQTMDTAPKDATWVALLTRDRDGTTWRYIAHFAEGGGEDQPPFGPGWFYQAGKSYNAECHGKPMYWAPLDDEPKAEPGEVWCDACRSYVHKPECVHAIGKKS